MPNDSSVIHFNDFKTKFYDFVLFIIYYKRKKSISIYMVIEECCTKISFYKLYVSMIINILK